MQVMGLRGLRATVYVAREKAVRNMRALVVLLVAIAAGIAAVVLANRWLTERTAEAGGVKVVVATKDLDLGTRLTPDMMQAVPWPKDSVPQGAFDNVDRVATRVVKTNVLRGEPILETKLAPIGTTGGLASVIKEGSRAMTVQVNEIVGVAGFALPGNYVDILVNTQDEKTRDTSKQISKIVLERVLVLAVAQQATRDDTKPKVVNAVTLEVTPEQAQKIDLARSVGTLTLVLRNQVDTAVVATAATNKRELLGAPPEAEPPKVVHHVVVKRVPVRVKNKKVRAETEKVEVIRGTSTTVEHFKVQE